MYLMWKCGLSIIWLLVISYPQLTSIFPSVVNKRSFFFFSCACGILIRMLCVCVCGGGGGLWGWHDWARAFYLKMNCWSADCGSDWKAVLEWITAAVGGSGFMSQSGACVVYTAKCSCVALIHILPYCTHRTREDICPPSLSVWQTCTKTFMRSHIHMQGCESPSPSHTSTRAVDSLSQRQVVLTEVCCSGRTA